MFDQTKEMSGDEFLTRKEAAEFLKVDRATLWRYTKRISDFPKEYRLGGTVRFRKSELIAHILSNPVK